jgi:HK97 family phage major capsid protein
MPENDSTNVVAGNATLGSVSLTPKTLQATTAYSRQLVAQSTIDVESFIRNDLAAVHALAWDAAVLHGTGLNNQPTGIYAAANVNSVAMGGVPTFGKLIDMVTEVNKDNALMGSLAFVTTPGLAGKLAQTVVASSTDTRMIWGGSLTEGNVVGYNAISSNQISATLGGGSEHGIIFGNFADVMIGMWGGGMEIVVDPYSLKKQGMIEITSFQLCDIALRYPQSFCKATGATIA